VDIHVEIQLALIHLEAGIHHLYFLERRSLRPGVSFDFTNMEYAPDFDPSGSRINV
jgi:hypothetical protein